MESIANDGSWATIRARAIENLSHVLRCAYCKEDGATDAGPDGRPWSIDHVIPKFYGGTDSPANLVKCCHRCNSKKHTKTSPEWTPDDDVFTASGMLYGEVKNQPINREIHPESFTGLEAYLGHVARLDQRIAELERELDMQLEWREHAEKYIWNVGRALRDIEEVAYFAKPKVQISYNPSNDRTFK